VQIQYSNYLLLSSMIRAIRGECVEHIPVNLCYNGFLSGVSKKGFMLKVFTLPIEHIQHW